jgi:hypothetical protein
MVSLSLFQSLSPSRPCLSLRVSLPEAPPPPPRGSRSLAPSVSPCLPVGGPGAAAPGHWHLRLGVRLSAAATVPGIVPRVSRPGLAIRRHAGSSNVSSSRFESESATGVTFSGRFSSHWSRKPEASSTVIVRSTRTVTRDCEIFETAAAGGGMPAGVGRIPSRRQGHGVQVGHCSNFNNLNLVPSTQ